MEYFQYQSELLESMNMEYLEKLLCMDREKMLFGMRVAELIIQEIPPQPNETLEQSISRIRKACNILEEKGILSMEFIGNGKMDFKILNPAYFPKITVH